MTEPIPPDEVIDSVTVRWLARRAAVQPRRSRRSASVSRNTLIRWRESRGFPAPFKQTEGGVELWDAREVRAWIAKQRGE